MTEDTSLASHGVARHESNGTPNDTPKTRIQFRTNPRTHHPASAALGSPNDAIRLYRTPAVMVETPCTAERLWAIAEPTGRAGRCTWPSSKNAGSAD